MELKNVFYAIVIPFLIFFASFAVFMYPARTLIHPHALVDILANFLPAGFAAPLAIIRNWSFALFYVMAEMWGSVVTSLLFWGFANEVTTVDEAKKYCKFYINQCLNIRLRETVSYHLAPYFSNTFFLFVVTSLCHLCLTTRSIVRHGSKRRTHLFWAICEMGFEHAWNTGTRCRCLGCQFEVSNGSCCS